MNNSEIDLELVQKQSITEAELKRIEQQEKLYAYYVGDEEAIYDYLEKALQINFSSVTINNMYKYYLNITEKVINQLSILYNKSAKREVLINGKVDIELSKLYNSLLPDNINSIDKLALSLARLLNVSLTTVGFDKDDKKIVYRVDPSHVFMVKSKKENINKINQISYGYYEEKRDGKNELITVVWTKDLHYEIDSNGNRRSVGDNVDMINPYNIIPVAVFRIKESADFWGFGCNDLVSYNEVINMMLIDLYDSGFVGSAYGTPLFTNCEIMKKKIDGSDTIGTIPMGAKNPVIVENVNTNMVKPTIEYATPKVDLTSIREAIDWQIKTIGVMKGLNPNSLLTEVKSTSGYSKIMDSIEEIHIREGVIEQALTYEKDRFRVTKAVINTYANELGYSMIPDNAEIKVTFNKVYVPKGDQEKWLDRESNYKYNTQSPADWLIEEGLANNSMEAEDILKTNKELNNKFPINEVKQAINIPNVTTK